MRIFLLGLLLQRTTPYVIGAIAINRTLNTIRNVISKRPFLILLANLTDWNGHHYFGFCFLLCLILWFLCVCVCVSQFDYAIRFVYPRLLLWIYMNCWNSKHFWLSIDETECMMCFLPCDRNNTFAINKSEIDVKHVHLVSTVAESKQYEQWYKCSSVGSLGAHTA